MTLALTWIFVGLVMSLMAGACCFPRKGCISFLSLLVS